MQKSGFNCQFVLFTYLRLIGNFPCSIQIRSSIGQRLLKIFEDFVNKENLIIVKPLSHTFQPSCPSWRFLV